MDDSELELYRTQLAQVEAALQADSENAELQTLRSELNNLIRLTESLDTRQPKDRNPQRHETRFSTGQEVLARYSADAKFYPARIVAIAGPPDALIYTVVYKGYGNTEMLPSSSMKHITTSSSPSSSSHPPPPGPA